MEGEASVAKQPGFGEASRRIVGRDGAADFFERLCCPNRKLCLPLPMIIQKIDELQPEHIPEHLAQAASLFSGEFVWMRIQYPFYFFNVLG